ncbi:MAG: ComEC/Rec2 family competence protein [Patescibacteria group bacterium]
MFRSFFCIIVFLFLVRVGFFIVDLVRFQSVVDMQAFYTFSGTVCSDPSTVSRNDDKTTFLFCIEHVSSPFASFDVSGRRFVSVFGFPELHRDDIVVLKGLFRPVIVSVDHDHSFLFPLRQFLFLRMKSIFREPSGSFLSGILLGIQGSLPFSVQEDFRVTGLTHILVFSGGNVSFFILFLNMCLGFMARRQRSFVLIAAIFLIVGLSGFSPPALRAALMGTLPLLALFFGRRRDVKRFFFLSGFALIFYNPWLVFDYGFLLSFSATFGILFVYPFFEKTFLARYFFGKIFLLTIAVQLSSLPIFFSFGNFSLIAPVTNTLLLPFLPFFLVSGIVAFVLPFLAPLFSVCVDLFLGLLHLFAKIPFASVVVPSFPIFLTVFYYFVLFVKTFEKD